MSAAVFLCVCGAREDIWGEPGKAKGPGVHRQWCKAAGLGWRQSYLTVYAAWSRGSPFGLQGVSDCAHPLWGSDQLNWKELYPGERLSGYHARPRVKISKAHEGTLLCCAVYHPAQKRCPEMNWDQQGQNSQHRWRRYCNSPAAALVHQSGGDAASCGAPVLAEDAGTLQVPPKVLQLLCVQHHPGRQHKRTRAQNPLLSCRFAQLHCAPVTCSGP